LIHAKKTTEPGWHAISDNIPRAQQKGRCGRSWARPSALLIQHAPPGFFFFSDGWRSESFGLGNRRADLPALWRVGLIAKSKRALLKKDGTQPGAASSGSLARHRRRHPAIFPRRIFTRIPLARRNRSKGSEGWEIPNRLLVMFGHDSSKGHERALPVLHPPVRGSAKIRSSVQGRSLRRGPATRKTRISL